MQSIKAQAHIGADGLLKLELPVGMADTDLELLIVMQPLPLSVPSEVKSIIAQHQTIAEKNGWPVGFFEQTYGSLANDPIERGSQPDYDVREEIA